MPEVWHVTAASLIAHIVEEGQTRLGDWIEQCMIC
jgi:hypothetical protein